MMESETKTPQTYGMDMREARERANRALKELVDEDDLKDHPPFTSGYETDAFDPEEEIEEEHPWWGTIIQKHPITVVYPIQGVLLSGFEVVIKPIDPRVNDVGGPGPGDHIDPAVIKMTPFGAPMPGMVIQLKENVRKGHRVILRDDLLKYPLYRKRMMEHLKSEGIPVHRVELLAGDHYPANFGDTIRAAARHLVYEARRRLALAVMGDH